MEQATGAGWSLRGEGQRVAEVAGGIAGVVAHQVHLEEARLLFVPVGEVLIGIWCLGGCLGLVAPLRR